MPSQLNEIMGTQQVDMTENLALSDFDFFLKGTISFLVRLKARIQHQTFSSSLTTVSAPTSVYSNLPLLCVLLYTEHLAALFCDWILLLSRLNRLRGHYLNSIVDDTSHGGFSNLNLSTGILRPLRGTNRSAAAFTHSQQHLFRNL